MLENFIIVGYQVLVLAVMILVGFICTKRGMFSEKGIRNITDFVLLIVNPCVIITSFHRKFDSSMAFNLLIAVAIAFVSHLLNILIAHLLIHDKDRRKEIVFRFGIVFSNCGFMGIPMVNSIVGLDGVFYCTAYISVFNILLWTYGYSMYSGKSLSSPKKVILNPGMIAVFTGLLFFFTPLELPSVIISSMNFFSALNTPVPMVIIGYNLAQMTSLAILKDKNIFAGIFLRLVVCPVMMFGILILVKYIFATLQMEIDPKIFSVMLICSAAACGGNTAMFAVKFNQDAETAGAMVSVSTVLSILTMPVVVGLLIGKF